MTFRDGAQAYPPPDNERIQQALAAMHQRRGRLRRRRIGGSGVAIAVVIAVVAAVAMVSPNERDTLVVRSPATTTSTSAGNAASGCVHLPITHVRNSYYGLPTPDGPSIDFRASQLASPTGDGYGNTVRTEGLSVQKTGPDGGLTLTLGDNANVILRGFGDFDGDGRGDLLVDTSVNGMDATYIVPGTVAPGTYDPAAVGVRVPSPYKPGDFAAWPASVGDQDLDRADDVSFGTELYSGRQLAALPAGAALPGPFRTLPSQYVGLLQLDENGPPSFVVPDPTGSGLEVLDERSDRLEQGADADPTELADAIRSGGGVTGWLVNGKHIVQFEYSSRSGASEWRWNLDAPCAT
jgi:hypothetical protein